MGGGAEDGHEENQAEVELRLYSKRTRSVGEHHCMFCSHCFFSAGSSEDKSFSEGSQGKCRRVAHTAGKGSWFSVAVTFFFRCALSLNWSRVSVQASPGGGSVFSQDLHEVVC